MFCPEIINFPRFIIDIDKLGILIDYHFKFRVVIKIGVYQSLAHAYEGI
jgi:hypothetical protein